VALQEATEACGSAARGALKTALALPLSIALSFDRVERGTCLKAPPVGQLSPPLGHPSIWNSKSNRLVFVSVPGFEVSQCHPLGG
jgi:hypothetical protein